MSNKIRTMKRRSLRRSGAKTLKDGRYKTLKAAIISDGLIITGIKEPPEESTTK